MLVNLGYLFNVHEEIFSVSESYIFGISAKFSCTNLISTSSKSSNDIQPFYIVNFSFCISGKKMGKNT